MWYIYILYSEGFDKYYVGYTKDYRRRLSEHNESMRNTYTSKYRPWEIKAVFECEGKEANVVNIEPIYKKTEKFCIGGAKLSFSYAGSFFIYTI